MYSFKNQYPTEDAPMRIRLSSGQTRTGGVYTEEELTDAGYKLVDNQPIVNSNQKVLWNNIIGDWHILDKSEDDIRHETALAWDAIRKKRNQLLLDSDWTQTVDYPGEFASNEERILKQKYKEYRDILRKLPQTYLTPDEVVWPIEPTV